ncbi:esterase/lipase family protein [Mesobacillus selenatarsenatis]|uniref:Alpha/beta fold hydrolase n=1 Tax=Mesobacillus selenatarsenatis TaxID=388741 RepID=A0A846U2X0_9BACI|nr:alpha/beta fold hydrolase [Mesobacillus selenatarsenatis]NKE08126.1 alpha/beta fold hydrolase [Mesobacillus selenatarsenatis]
MSLLMVLLLMVPVGARAGDLGGGSSGVSGTWYVGAEPSWVDPAKAPIVFVHGYNNSASVWWEGNDMYETALANGYQTAFIDLYSDRDMWENGAMLAQKLKVIYDYFGQKKLIVVGYSKGGVDAQTALVHYGAHPYVSNMISLSSPHHGTQLSDLAHSSAAWWLAALLGNNNDATRSLQTGNMKYFRSITDGKAETKLNKYYTLGGYKWGSFGSALYWGGLYLSSYGSNDGVVTVSSSRLPGGTIIREGAWNHTTIREGSYTFSVFKPYTMSEQTAGSNAFSAASMTEPVSKTNQIVKGGKADKAIKEDFVIEDGAESFQMAFLSEKKLSSLKLKGPDGQEYKAAKVEQDTGEFFKGAWVHSFKIDKPEAGKWKVTGPAAAYMLVVGIDSPLVAELKDAKNQKVKASYKTKWIKYDHDGKKKLKETGKGSKAGKVLDGDLTESGVYNLTTDVTGFDAKGKPFERTIIESIYVDENGKTHR